MSSKYSTRPHIVLDKFDDHPFSYPYIASAVPSTASLSNNSPTSSHAPTSANSPPSIRSSTTSWETAWFHDSTSDHDHKSSVVLSDRDHSVRNSVMTADVFDDSCQFDTNDWFAQFDGQLDVSDDPPSREALEQAGDIPVFDSAGNSRQFKSLYSLGDVVGDRQLLVFIRHFYCGACKAYVNALINTINAQTYFTMPVPTSIVIIGCGSPELIRQYKATTGCPFPIFADPSRQIFKLLGMGINFNAIANKRPQYMKDISPHQWASAQFKEMAKVKGKKRFQGGNMLQIGGEFLFEDGEVVWCHRMKNMRGHAEMDVIKRILDIER